MKRLEDELRNALRRAEPPVGFAERVLARAASPKRAWSFAAVFGVRGMRWAAAGAMALVLVAGGLDYQQQREERARGEAAKAQLMMALRIAGSKLQYAQARVQQIQGFATQQSNTEKIQ